MRVLDGVLFGNALWLLVAVGWIVLLLLGLEADKPLSGDLPSRHESRSSRWISDWDEGDQMGETLGWALFGAICVALFFVLHWILTAHGYGLWLPGL